ncbi:MAG TPA: penicillin-binding transpeptidase domain-containing protein, partial [Aquabacterium sp.]|nr:penicillin-binding transpeptidase domain-containing protein [Aquabacterium sp.]
LDDSPVQLPTASGVYRPQNYDHRFKGWVSVRQALGSSLNIPAVRAGALLGPEAVAQRFNALGLGLREPGSFYGPGLALGGAEVTLRDLSNAYRTLARGGGWSPVRLSRSGPDTRPVFRQVLRPEAAFLVTDILADNNARASTFGLDSVLATRGFAAVKTGTSKDMRDNWCVGFTDRFTVGVWVGNASGEPMHEVSGVSGAAPVWSRLVSELHRAQPSRAPAAPAGLVAQAIAFQGWPTPEPARQEWFIAGTQQALWQVQATPPGRAILNPQDGAIYAIDPDMPPQVQRVLFTRSEQARGLSWWLDGRRLSQAERHAWLPWPGRHQLELRRGPQVVDAVHFEVRGAGVKATPATGPQRRRAAAFLAAGVER